MASSGETLIWVAAIGGLLSLLAAVFTGYFAVAGKKAEARPKYDEMADTQETELRKELRDENKGLKVANKELERANRLLEIQNEELQRANQLLISELELSKTDRARLQGEVMGLKEDVLALTRKVRQLENGHGNGGKQA